MGIKYKTKTNKLPKISKSIETMSSRKVQIGSLNGDLAWLAGIHEYGMNITVTPAMRAWLHYNGLHLKKETTEIKIPERSFIRSTFDSEGDRIMKQTERAIGQVLAGKMSVNEMLDMCGQQFATAIKARMSETDANHPFTIEQKGSSTPLTGKSGALVDSITWKIE